MTSRLPPAEAVPTAVDSETGPSNRKAGVLNISEAPEILDESDYPQVSYWYESNWMENNERQKDCRKSVSKLGFLTDQNGNPVTESRIKEFTSQARQLWTELYRHRLDPTSWTKKTLTAASYFAHEMKGRFSEFRYCDGNWKVERFAIIKYPDWCRDGRDTGRLTRALIFSSFQTANIFSTFR